MTATASAPASLARPRNAGQPHWQKGRELARRRDWRGAARAFGRAAAATPGDALYWVNLANAERHDQAFDRAEAAARRALALEPDNTLARQVLGECLAQMHRYAEALEVLQALDACGQQEPEALVRQASMLQQLMRAPEAVPVLLRALAQQPTLVAAHALLADVLRDQGLKREAVECMRTVLALDPGHLETRSRMSFEKRHTCDWSELDEDVAQISQSLTANALGQARAAAVFGLLSLPLAPELQRRAGLAEALALTGSVQPLPPVLPSVRQAAAASGARIRVGWLSYDFREHPVSQLLVEVLEQCDRDRFELCLYSAGEDDRTPLRRRVEGAADRFLDIRGLSDRQAAERIRADGVDILIDLMGFTRGNRLAVLAHRPAPLQVAYLGYPASTGAPFIDYIIGDPVVTPLALDHLYSEKLAQMPLCFQPNGRWRPLPQPLARAAAGLPDDAFVLCAFNHTYKILPEAFDAWCEVLRNVPHAVLWLKETNAQLHANVRREAAARGVDPARVLFAPTVAYADHFSRLALADVFVDTWPYNAHTTASDALWAGVPVVTRYGDSYASRVAASVVNAAGIGELAFENQADYRCAILALALDPALLSTYRQHLVQHRHTLPLFDTERYTGELMNLFERMVVRWRAGLPCDHLLASLARPAGAAAERQHDTPGAQSVPQVPQPAAAERE